MSEQNKALLQRWFEEVWNQGRRETIDELLADNVVAHGLDTDGSGPLYGREAFKQFHASFHSAFPNIVVTVEDTIAEGDRIATRCSVRGTHSGDTLGFAATKRAMEIGGMVIVRVENGKIVEAWNNFDFMRLYQQLGVI